MSTKYKPLSIFVSTFLVYIQFVTCDASLLNIPNIRNTELVLSIKSYLLRRILQIVGSYDCHKKHFHGKSKDGKNIYRNAKKLEKTILLDSLFSQCDLADVPKNRKAEHLFIDWFFEKEGGKFRAVKIEL